MGGVTVASSDGHATATQSVNGNVVTVNLVSVSDGQSITIALTNVSTGTNIGNIAIPMGILLGDSNQDGFVNAGDTLSARNLSGQVTNDTNFRSDVNTDGFVNGGDALVVRSHAGDSLP